jgi:hypothetical protein
VKPADSPRTAISVLEPPEHGTGAAEAIALSQALRDDPAFTPGPAEAASSSPSPDAVPADGQAEDGAERDEVVIAMNPRTAEGDSTREARETDGEEVDR